MIGANFKITSKLTNLNRRNDMEKETAIVESNGNTPADMIRLAVGAGTDLDKLEKLLKLQEAFEANQAKKAYVRAMADFKAHAPLVSKDKVNSQYKSKYTTLGNLINTVSPVLSKFGLSASWDIEQNGIVKVSCKITHELGHSETAHMTAPVDVSGSKNPIQQIKSTITYLKAVTFESICGLASTDANCDDDGAGATETISEKELHQILDLMLDAKVDEKKFCTYLKVERIEDLPKSEYKKALQGIADKKRQGAK